MIWALPTAPAGAVLVSITPLASIEKGSLDAGPYTSDFITSPVTCSLDIGDLTGQVWKNSSSGTDIYTYIFTVDPRSTATNTWTGTYNILEFNTALAVLGFNPDVQKAGYDFYDT